MAKTRREFTHESKREATALLESSSRPPMQVAAELGIQHSMLSKWHDTLNGPSSGPQSAGLTGALLPSPVASPSNQVADIVRLRQGLERPRMERDGSKKPSATSRSCPSDLRLEGAACADPAGASHVPRAPGLAQRLPRMALRA